MKRTLLCFAVAACSAFGQAADKPQFDAVSIKPSAPDARGGGYNISSGRLNAKNRTLKDLVRFAWDLQDYQLSGGPGWTDTEHFEVLATYPTGTPPKQQEQMMQALLGDRFGLTLHSDPKEVSGYGLVMAKNGPKLKAAEATEPGMMLGRGQSGLRTLTGTRASMSSLATMLADLLGRPVEDKTGIEGVYDFQMAWTPDSTSGGKAVEGKEPVVADESGPTIFTALQESLGLRLESRKVTVGTMTIDRVEKPREN